MYPFWANITSAQTSITLKADSAKQLISKIFMAILPSILAIVFMMAFMWAILIKLFPILKVFEMM